MWASPLSLHRFLLASSGSSTESNESNRWQQNSNLDAEKNNPTITAVWCHGANSEHVLHV